MQLVVPFHAQPARKKDVRWKKNWLGTVIYEWDEMEFKPMKLAAHCHVEVNVDRSQWDPIGLDFLHLGQRHFEKELPFPVSYTPGPTGCSLYRLPIDFVRMVMPTVGGVTDSIEEILVAYGNKGQAASGI